VIPTLISQALYRDHIEVGNLSTTRDFTFVSNTVSGLIAAAESDRAIGQEINLGTGREITIADLLDEILRATGAKKPVRRTAFRMRDTGAEVRRLVSNNRKALKLLGWAPGVGLAEGLAQTVEFVKAHPELYNPEAYRI
jgi:dTDP-glucose 4,6-dehydratase